MRDSLGRPAPRRLPSLPLPVLGVAILKTPYDFRSILYQLGRFRLHRNIASNDRPITRPPSGQEQWANWMTATTNCFSVAAAL